MKNVSTAIYYLYLWLKSEYKKRYSEYFDFQINASYKTIKILYVIFFYCKYMSMYTICIET